MILSNIILILNITLNANFSLKSGNENGKRLFSLRILLKIVFIF